MDVKVTKVDPKWPATGGRWAAFQKRWGITADDKPGDETHGQVEEVEKAYRYTLLEKRNLEKAVEAARARAPWVFAYGFAAGMMVNAIIAMWAML